MQKKIWTENRILVMAVISLKKKAKWGLINMKSDDFYFKQFYI